MIFPTILIGLIFILTFWQNWADYVGFLSLSTTTHRCGTLVRLLHFEYHHTASGALIVCSPWGLSLAWARLPSQLLLRIPSTYSSSLYFSTRERRRHGLWTHARPYLTFVSDTSTPNPVSFPFALLRKIRSTNGSFPRTEGDRPGIIS